MGASSSKPELGSQHVFRADVPVNFSENLVNSLQTSSETNGTRANNLELLIQSRVTAELKKQLESSQQKLSHLADSISKDASPDSQNPEDANGSTDSLLGRLKNKLSSDDQDSKSRSDLDRDAVSKEIAELRKKLDSRKKLVEVDKDVEKAKDKVVECLRLNDRRPLDCWKEVEKFKTEVGRLERDFVERNAS